jgi:mono/diheme cytochrome c family protein
MPHEMKTAPAALALAGLVGVLSVTAFLPSAARAAESKKTDSMRGPAALTDEAKKGSALFHHNCAACHGDDARGDEGPSLHNLAKSNARITTIIKGGIKGEMPAFSKKFGEPDILALIAYLRTLKE